MTVKLKLLLAILFSTFAVSAYANSHIHYGANPAAVNDVHIVNLVANSYSVTTPYGIFPLDGSYPGNSMWIDFAPGTGSICVTIVRDYDGKLDFSGCGLTSGSEIDVPVSHHLPSTQTK